MTVRPGHATWAALGTTAAVTVTQPRALPAARAAVERELEALDLACSRFREDSELSRVNDAAGGAVRVGPVLLEAVRTALRAAALTDGAVDPTIGAALVRAGYDRDFAAVARAPRRPLHAVRVPGWRTVRIDEVAGTVALPRGARLDLGATAKALAADRAAAAAAAAAPGAGVLVGLGGDLALAGPAPEGGWVVRVADDHRAPEGAPGQTVLLNGGGLATSSTTVRRWGTGRHHLIDPATGLPAQETWRTASVAAASCVDANVASTAAILLGERAPAWLAERGLPARLVARDGAVQVVGAWPAQPAEVPA